MINFIVENLSTIGFITVIIFGAIVFVWAFVVAGPGAH